MAYDELNYKLGKKRPMGFAAAVALHLRDKNEKQTATENKEPTKPAKA